MDLSTIIFSRPKFRDGVSARMFDGKLDIDYREQGCSIEVDGESFELVQELVSELKKGDSSFEELQGKLSGLGEALNDIILEFDRLGLLTELDLPSVISVMSGRDFYYTRLLPTLEKVQYELGDSPLFERMLSGIVTKRELIGFALEYYHLVKLSPSLIGPALCHVCNEAIRSELLKLFVEEYDHDKMMIASLKAEGIDEKQLLQRQPLPTSYCAYVSLGVYARQHILSFYSALILFESPSLRFNEVFVDACRKLGMSEAFYKPLVKHSDINEDGQHDLVTFNLLSQVKSVSEQEQNTILIHMIALVEMLHKQDKQIVDYYGNPDNDLMRVF